MGALFDRMLSLYLDSHSYDEAEEALFRVVHEAFAAGWKAAGGEALSEIEETDKFAFLDKHGNLL